MLIEEIYEKAERTIAWLGEEDEDREVLLEMIELFVSHPLDSLQNDASIIKPKARTSRHASDGLKRNSSPSSFSPPAQWPVV